MGGRPSSLPNANGKTLQDDSREESERLPRRTLDGKKKGMKIRTGGMKAQWMDEMPEISIFKDVIRIKDTNDNFIELKGDQDDVEIAGFQMTTRSIQEPDGRKGYGIGINTKVLNLATFEIEVQKDGNILLTGRKLKTSKEGHLKLLTLPQVTPRDVTVDALDDNRTIWIRIYYENPANLYSSPPVHDMTFHNKDIHLALEGCH